ALLLNNRLSSAPPYETISPCKNTPRTPTNPDLHLTNPISDDHQSESDGLYASVGHSATGCSTLRKDSSLIAPDNLTVIRSTADPVQSGSDSAQGPYYSSVVSVGSPTEYGEIEDVVPPRTQDMETNASTNRTCRFDVYARVKPRSERHLNQTLDYPNANIPVPVRVASPGEATCTLGPVVRSVTAVSVEPPIPERGYGQKEIEIVNQNRLLISGSTVSGQSEHADTTRSVGPPDANVPLIRRLLNAIQLTNARHYHDPDLIGNGSPSTGGGYRKITVRESLASLRARNALPIVDALPTTSTGVYYERVYGVTGESNSSATYEVVPGPRGCVGGLTEFQSSTRGANGTQEIVESQSKRFSDVYSEIPCACVVFGHRNPFGFLFYNLVLLNHDSLDTILFPFCKSLQFQYTTCYALPFSSPPGTSSPNTALVGGEISSDMELPVASSTLNRSVEPSTSAMNTGTSDLDHRSVSLTPDKVNNTSDEDAVLMPVSRNPPHTVHQSAASLNETNPVASSVLLTSHSFCHGLMPPLMERSVEDASLVGPSHRTTSSLSSSALSSPLNDTELISSLDSDRLFPSPTPNSFAPSTCSGSCFSRPVFLNAPSTHAGPVDWVPVDQAYKHTTCRSDTVTYDEVAS
ncbi:hypothetical protein FBUS_06887, partial [Fasciolopsis buskii]